MNSLLHKNPSVAQKFSSPGNVKTSVQPKLYVNTPGDEYEQEADAMADRVMRMPANRNSYIPKTGIIGSSVQRKCTSCEEEEKKKKPVMRKTNFGSAGMQASDSLVSSLNATKGRGTLLPQDTRSFMENAFSADFSKVRLHIDGQAAEMSREINAKAFTHGNDIYFGSGEYSPNTESGKKLLTHELTHTIQQERGILSRIQRFVENVEINCADNQIRFQHDGIATSYNLDHCNITDGNYNAKVKLSSNRVDFDLGIVPKGTQFDFSYSVAPGQPNPNTLFNGQNNVAITCSNTPSLTQSPGDIKFSVKKLTNAEFLSLTGNSANSIPEGIMVPLSNFIGQSLPSAMGPATAGASYFSPTPWTFIPKNVTGVLWTQGHTSIFSNPEGTFSPTIKGYRGNLAIYVGESLPLVGRQCTIQLHEGVPGSFANDAWFPLMPGEKNFVFAPRSVDQALSFAERLQGKQYGGEYTYSPPRSEADTILGEVKPKEANLNADLTARGKAPMCTNNCITVPKAEIEAAIGGRPVTSSGVDVMTGSGPNGVADPHYAGRGRLMTDAMKEGPLPQGASRMNLTVTPGGSAGMFVIRGAGYVMIVYGIYQTGSRIANTERKDLPVVLSEEAGSWTGGILGSALGGAAGGALFCAPTGPVDAVCVVGGFVGGLIFGIAGSKTGQAIGHTVGEYVVDPVVNTVDEYIVQPVVKKTAEVESSWTIGILNLYGVPRL